MSNARALIRTGAFLLLGSAVGAANAVSIGISSAGTTDFTNFTDIVVQENVLFQTGGFGPLNSLHADIDGSTLFGTGTYTGASDTLNFDLTITNIVTNGNSQSIDGNWTYTSGTGTYANLAGSGTFAQTLLINTTPAQSFFTFSGDLAPVPEPATLAILGCGLVAVVSRRRKKA